MLEREIITLEELKIMLPYESRQHNLLLYYASSVCISVKHLVDGMR